jgi:hypothetical protein
MTPQELGKAPEWKCETTATFLTDSIAGLHAKTMERYWSQRDAGGTAAVQAATTGAAHVNPDISPLFYCDGG